MNAGSNARTVSDPVTHPHARSPGMAWLASLPHRDCLELDALDTAPREARRWLAGLLPQWSLPQFQTVSALIATELTTNAVAATTSVRWASARPPIRLWLCGGPSVVTVLTWDASVLAAMPRDAGTGDESGRGLAIVAALSAAWGFYYPAEFGGKVTWAIIDTP